MLSSEQGVYIAESVANKNMKQAKGRFRVYEDDDDDGVILDIYSSFVFSFIFLISMVHIRVLLLFCVIVICHFIVIICS